MLKTGKLEPPLKEGAQLYTTCQWCVAPCRGLPAESRWFP